MPLQSTLGFQRMVPIPRIASSLALLLGLALSGCVDHPVSPVERFAIGEPRGFSALVTSTANGEQGWINLSGPVRVPDRTGSMVDAYLYEQALPHQGEYQRLYYYLDGDLREIGSVLGCGYVLLGCDRYVQRYWQHEGQPGPDGLWYPDLLVDEGGLVSKDAGHVSSIPFDARLDGEGRLVLEIEPPWSQGQRIAYRYVEDRVLPDGPRFQVERYEDHGQLQRIDTRPLPAPPLPPRQWEGLMFPQEAEDPFAVGATHVEIATFAFPAVNSDPDVCIEFYELQPQAPRSDSSDVLPITLPQYGADETAKAVVRAIQDGNATEVQVAVTRSRLDGSITMSRSSGTTGPAPLSCKEMYRSPWPSTDFEAARTTAAGLLGADQLGVFTFQVGYMARYRDQGPEHGLHTYLFDFLPEGTMEGGAGLFDMYRVHFEASGALTTLSALAHPDATFER